MGAANGDSSFQNVEWRGKQDREPISRTSGWRTTERTSQAFQMRCLQKYNAGAAIQLQCHVAMLDSFSQKTLILSQIDDDSSVSENISVGSTTSSKALATR
eukprot:COSAG01_NODE_4452_length_5007_cov_1.898737_5_plen_101_part_00